jgi:hypothetical protein
MSIYKIALLIKHELAREYAMVIWTDSVYVNRNSQLQDPCPETCTSSLPGPAGEPGKLDQDC